MIIDVRNPLVWLRRIRHRRGYGVHSPFAFGLITEVVYSPGRFYAYDSLNTLHTMGDCLLRPRRRAVCRLLFRLANFRQPRCVCVLGGGEKEHAYLQAGCRQAVLVDHILPHPHLIYIKEWEQEELPVTDDGGLVIVDELKRNRVLWNRLKRSGIYQVTMDLHDVGLAFRREGMQADDYVVNW